MLSHPRPPPPSERDLESTRVSALESTRVSALESTRVSALESTRVSALDERAQRAREAAWDVALMARAARGDVAAFEAIYDRHAPRALALCLRLLPNRADAEEVLHDVFCEAWGAVTQFDPARGNVIAWLLVRVRSRALDRRARLRREPSGPLPEDARASTEPTAERQVALRQALAQLDPTLLRTLELSYFEGLTSVEVARLMGIPEGTVKSRLARGVAALQHFFRLEPSEEQP